MASQSVPAFKQVTISTTVLQPVRLSDGGDMDFRSFLQPAQLSAALTNGGIQIMMTVII